MPLVLARTPCFLIMYCNSRFTSPPQLAHQGSGHSQGRPVHENEYIELMFETRAPLGPEASHSKFALSHYMITRQH